MSVRWQKDGEYHLLVSSFPWLGQRGPRVGPAGIEAGIFRRRSWPWSDIAAVTWDLDWNSRGTLAVCLHGDPWVKVLPAVVWSWPRSWDEWRGLLEQIRPVVEQMGARLENRDEAATHWWHLDPEARRR